MIPTLLDGSIQCAFGGAERHSRQDMFDIKTEAVQEGDSFTLSGKKTLVQNGAEARYLVVSARTSGKQREKEGITLFLVDTERSRVETSVVSLMDGSKVANIGFENLHLGSDAVIGEVGYGNRLIEVMVSEARIAVAAEMVGIMDVLREKTVDYSRTRKQFGVAIGSFQALQHRMVEMFMATEQCRSILYRAICEYQQKEATSESTISAMKSFIGQKSRLVGEESIQLHGGMGMTDELDIGHYVKRLMVLNHLFGDVDSSYRDFCNSKYVV